jgi:hypothetical protein
VHFGCAGCFFTPLTNLLVSASFCIPTCDDESRRSLLKCSITYV